MKIFNKFIKILTVIALVFITNFATKANAQTATTGSITIDNAAKGKTYAIYKLFDATVTADGTGISYKVPTGKTLDASNTWFRTDAAGNVLIKDGITNASLETEEFKTWALSFGNQVQEPKVANGESVVFSGVPFGYYVVKSTLDNGKFISVDSTMPNVVIKDKNDNKPKIDPNDPTAGKTIRVGVNDDAAGRDTQATYAIGDKIPFQIKFTATNFLTENRKNKAITEYKIVDTPTNLKILKETLSVKVGSNVLEPTKYTVSINDQTGAMTVVIPWINTTETTNGKIDGSPLYNPTETVILTYDSLVMGGAAENASATNQAAITYKTKEDPTVPEDPRNPDPETPVVPKQPDPQNPDKPVNPTISLYKITLNKFDATTRTALTGAKFKLYDTEALGQGNEIKVVKVVKGDGSSYYRLAEKDANGDYTEEGVEIEAGTAVEIRGLKGLTTYYLEETVAPNGYNRLTARQATTTSKVQDDKTVASDVTADVPNNIGTELPSTGGIGRTIFYVLGTGLLGAVVVVFISRMKMKTA